jgi:hypothetical protein
MYSNGCRMKGEFEPIVISLTYLQLKLGYTYSLTAPFYVFLSFSSFSSELGVIMCKVDCIVYCHLICFTSPFLNIVSVIDDATCEQRLWDMKQRGDKNFYLCEISKDFTIDATFKGNISRFLNHSCEPNCKLEKW